MKSTRAVLLMIALLMMSNARAAEEAPQAVAAGTGKASFSNLLQGWFVNDSTTPLLNFRIRRAELVFKGSVLEGTRWFVMVDAAKTLKTGPITATNDNKILQDLGVVFTPFADFEIQMGQFKTPTTFEGTAPTSELPLPERSLSGRTYGDKREPGLMVTYKSGILKAQAMISNGMSANVDDTNDKKDLHVRLEAALNNDLLVGAFATFGDFGWDAKGRVGGNVKYSLTDVTIRAEVVQAHDASVTNSTGWMFDVAYMINENWMPAARFDGIRTSGTFTGHETTVGINYLVRKHNARATFAYSYLNNMSGALGSPSLKSGTTGHLIWLAFQAAI